MPMLGTWAQTLKFPSMLFSSISLVALKPVARVALAELSHQAIPPHFGYYRGGRDREHALISARNGFLRYFQLRDPHVVDKKTGRLGIERFDGSLHGGSSCRQ
jgi:hypothetical protein